MGLFLPSMLAKHKVGSSTLLTRSTFKPVRNKGFFIFQLSRFEFPSSGQPSTRDYKGRAAAHRKSDESSPPGVLSRAATIVLHRDFHVEIPRDGTWLGIWLDRRE